MAMHAAEIAELFDQEILCLVVTTGEVVPGGMV
jgi:hypothetical protein